MKKLFTALLLVLSLTLSSQVITDKSKSVIGEYINVDKSLEKVKSIEDLFVHYSKEVTEGSKTLIGNGVEVLEKTVDLLVEQSTIIVTQFIVYTSISYAIPIIFGILLLFWLPRKIREKLSIDSQVAIDFNNAIDEEDSFYTKSKKLLFSGVYYNNIVTLLLSNFGTYFSYIAGAYLVVNNVMPFIKVTFFSKLYLVELLLKYV